VDRPGIELVKLDFPEGCNIILGQSHFIKTVEDLYEAVSGTVPGARFGLAFAEASGPRLVRSDGTDLELRSIAEKNILKLQCGHVFMIVLHGVFSPYRSSIRLRMSPKFAGYSAPLQIQCRSSLRVPIRAAA